MSARAVLPGQAGAPRARAAGRARPLRASCRAASDTPARVSPAPLSASNFPLSSRFRPPRLPRRRRRAGALGPPPARAPHRGHVRQAQRHRQSARRSTARRTSAVRTPSLKTFSLALAPRARSRDPHFLSSSASPPFGTRAASPPRRMSRPLPTLFSRRARRPSLPARPPPPSPPRRAQAPRTRRGSRTTSRTPGAVGPRSSRPAAGRVRERRARTPRRRAARPAASFRRRAGAPPPLSSGHARPVHHGERRRQVRELGRRARFRSPRARAAVTRARARDAPGGGAPAGRPAGARPRAPRGVRPAGPRARRSFSRDFGQDPALP